MKAAILPFALGAAVASAVLLGLNPIPRPLVEAPAAIGPVEPPKSVFLYDWTKAGALGDLMVCTCEAGRLEKAATPKRRGAGP